MTRTSILFLSHEFPPLGGGAGLNGFNLCEELVKRGWTIHVVTQRPPRSSTRLFAFPITYIPSFRKRQLQTSFSSMLFFIAGALFCMLRQNRRFDMIFSNMAIPAGIAGAIISFVAKKPHIIWHHGGDVHGGKISGAGAMQRFLLHAVWKGATATCFVSSGLRTLAQSYGNLHNDFIIPVAPLMSKSPALPTMLKPEYFLFLGRLEKVKNPLVLIRAIETLKKSCPVLPHFKIIGDGILFDAIQSALRAAQLEKAVTLQKNIPHDQVHLALQSAYAIICSSVIEGFNTTILEAGFFGVPAIGSNVPEINALIQHRKNGLLFESNNAAELALCIKELYENASLRDILGKNAVQTASAFSIDRSADAFENMCAQGLNAGSRKPR